MANISSCVLRSLSSHASHRPPSSSGPHTTAFGVLRAMRAALRKARLKGASTFSISFSSFIANFSPYSSADCTTQSLMYRSATGVSLRFAMEATRLVSFSIIVFTCSPGSIDVDLCSPRSRIVTSGPTNSISATVPRTAHFPDGAYSVVISLRGGSCRSVPSASHQIEAQLHFFVLRSTPSAPNASSVFCTSRCILSAAVPGRRAPTQACSSAPAV